MLSTLLWLALGSGSAGPPLQSVLRARYPVCIRVETGEAWSRFRASELRDRIAEHPAWKSASRRTDLRKALSAVRFFAGALDLDVDAALEQTLGAEWVLGAMPPEKGEHGADAVLAIRLRSEDSAARLFEALDHLLNLFAAERGAGVSDGAIRSANGKEFHARSGDCVLIASRRDALAAVLADLASSGPAGEASSPSFLEVDVDLQALRDAGRFQPAPLRQDNAIGALLLHGLFAAYDEARALRVRGAWHGGSLDVAIALEGVPGSVFETDAWYFPPAAKVQPVAPAPGVPGLVFALTLQRDLPEFYRRRLELLSPDQENAALQFETGANLVFANREFGDEVLGALAGPVTLTAELQDYADAKQPPKVRLPGVTLGAPLDVAKLPPDALATAFQTLISFVNVDRTQKGQATLLLGADASPACRLYDARYLDDAPRDSDDLRFNARPALALVTGEQGATRFFLGTARRTVEAAVAAAKDPAAGAAPLATRVRLDVPRLREGLAADREALIAQRMLEKGEGESEAGDAIDLFLLALAPIGAVQLDVDRAEDAVEIDLSIGVAPGSERR